MVTQISVTPIKTFSLDFGWRVSVREEKGGSDGLVYRSSFFNVEGEHVYEADGVYNEKEANGFVTGYLAGRRKGIDIGIQRQIERTTEALKTLFRLGS